LRSPARVRIGAASELSPREPQFLSWRKNNTDIENEFSEIKN